MLASTTTASGRKLGATKAIGWDGRAVGGSGVRGGGNGRALHQANQDASPHWRRMLRPPGGWSGGAVPRAYAS
ncbi:MAG: hypothetical protein ACRDL8_09020, partial [Solirubrobacteraceae bacterium]